MGAIKKQEFLQTHLIYTPGRQIFKSTAHLPSALNIVYKVGQYNCGHIVNAMCDYGSSQVLGCYE